MMKITITTTPKEIEKVNYLLAQVVSSLRGNPRLGAMMLKEYDLDKIDNFRAKLINELLKDTNETP